MDTILKIQKHDSQIVSKHQPEKCKLSYNIRKVGIASLIIALSIAIPSSLEATEKKKKQDQNLHVRQAGYGHLVARALHVACYYKLFDALQKGPKLAEEIAFGKKYQASGVKRLMRILANHGVVTMDENERFSLNKNSKILVSTAPQSFQPALAKEFDLTRWQAVGNIHLAMTDNVIPYDHLFGMSYYAYLERNDAAAKLFNAGMKNFSEQEDEQVSKAYAFKDFKTICDIGGGTGGLMSRVLSQHPHVQGILFDLPEAIKECTLT